MPTFIGNEIDGAVEIESNAEESRERVKLTYAQAVRLSCRVECSLNTSDKGSRGVMAKRWFNWFARPSDVLEDPNSTQNMKERATHALNL